VCLISKKLILFIKNQYCSLKKSVQKLDSATSNFFHSVEFLNTSGKGRRERVEAPGEEGKGI
jgi:hypothetical protein